MLPAEAAADTGDGENSTSPKPAEPAGRELRATHPCRRVRETGARPGKTPGSISGPSYYLDRDKFDDSQSEAWALGGSIGLKTGYFRERFALGATGYTSQRLHGPEHKDGTLLLEPGQHGYTVLGELYGEFLLDQETRLSIGRRGIDTPYLNRSDSRMTPNTFEAITVQGLHGGGEGRAEWRAGGGYVDAIKERNSDEFVSMATVAGAPDGVDRGVYVGGFNYSRDEFSIGAIDYYSDDILNIFYTEAKYVLPLDNGLRLQFALQYSDTRERATTCCVARIQAGAWGWQGRKLGMGAPCFRCVHPRQRRHRHAEPMGRLSGLHQRTG